MDAAFAPPGDKEEEDKKEEADDSRTSALYSTLFLAKLNRARKKKLGASVAASTYDLNYGIPSKKATHTFVAREKGHDSWQLKIHDFIDQQWVQYVLIGLLVSDILIIFAELFLQSEFPACRLIERDCLACCPSDGYAGEGGSGRWLAESFCQDQYADTGTAACDKHKWDGVHTAEEVLFSITIIILSIFLIENVAECAALGPKKFFSQLFLALDFFVVTISLVFELIFHIYKSHFQEIVAVLVLFRVWRFVRVGHAILEVSSELTSKEYECLFEYINECEEKFKENGIVRPEKSDAVKALIDGHLGHGSSSHVANYHHGGHHHQNHD